MSEETKEAYLKSILASIAKLENYHGDYIEPSLIQAVDQALSILVDDAKKKSLT